ncbi:hypothetical protein [Actinomadura sediminis]|uniref:Uncharacterized protein n=1 Tax=Actinomadura sediminis TaxID=1038904 RepID=A0ABW3EJA5_9ACTN
MQRPPSAPARTALRARASRYAGHRTGRRAATPGELLARMLVVALGLLGLVGGQGPHTAASGASATPASVSGAGPRTGAVQGVPSRGRPAPAGLADRGNARHAETAAAALARQTDGTAAPLWQSAPPPPDTDVRPPHAPAVRPAAAPGRPAVAPRAGPRGRAPPASARI